MEANSIVSSSNFTVSSLRPLISTSHQDIMRHRGRMCARGGKLVLPIGVNLKTCGIRTRSKCLSFCVKGGGREKLEAVGVPTSVPVRVAHELLLAGHRYLDVRTPEEFSAGHAVGAINIPYMYKLGSGMTKNPKFLQQVSSQFGKYDEIIVGCQSGKRSMMAATDLLAVGYSAVTDIAGGFAAWTQNGLPTED